jgi:hypothetical protein
MYLETLYVQSVHPTSAEHLLLGLLREERSVAAEVLAARGLRKPEDRSRP